MKKTILSLLILISIMSLFVLSSFAQKQRLGIRPQEITINGAAGSSVNVEAFCFDRHVFIDGKYEYKYLHTDERAVRVIVGGKKYSLSEAIRTGKIKVFGRTADTEIGEEGLFIEITKLVPEKVVVKVEKVSVFRDTPGTYKNQKAMEALNASEPSQNSDITQDAVWTQDVDRSRLETLGFGSVREFQQKYNLPESDDFNAQTSAKLLEVESAFIKLFELNYLVFNRRGTKVKSLADNINKLQNIYEVEAPASLTSDVSALFKRYVAEHLPVIKELKIFSDESGSYVLKIEPSYGKNEFTYHSPFEVLKIKDTKTLAEILVDWSKEDRDINVYLEGFSPEKAAGLEASLNIQAINMFKNDSTKGKFFLTGIVTQMVSSSPITKIGQEYRTTIVYKTVKETTNQRMNVTAKLRDSVSKFVDSFKRLVDGKRSLPSIVSEARKNSAAVRLGFGELGEIEIIELFREKSLELITE